MDRDSTAAANSWRTPPSPPRAIEPCATSRDYNFCLYDQNVTGVTESHASIAVEARPGIIWSKRTRRADRHHANHTISRRTKFDPETTRIMGVAFGMARAAVKRDWGGVYCNRVIAKQIIELAKAGERDPDVLCEQALSYFLRDYLRLQAE